ncbi:TonB-dependent receptor [Roseospirillum parvum]|uniref:Iron complex outermembrane recepter protein n=1 Tax=Roseospirillum parvum TaxID=83401 RepID=A0A1G8C4I5_9PROT|nr:TonB-dependent receptor [Roseospirillum parvum]SDH40295.1 iron complex outermembrane recepter protein [Roseospirillum parvum]
MTTREWRLPACLGLSVVLAGAVATPGARAEERPTTAETETLLLAPVTVTARKRAEVESDIPVAMTTLGSDEITAAGIETIEDVARHAPGLNFSQGSQSRYSTINLRGVGSLVPGGYEDGSLSAYVDGVPVPMSMLDTTYRDLERIEVLRGPQGTLYGKNAQAGAINIITRAPSDQTEAELGFDLGTDGRRRASGLVGGALVPGLLAGRLSVDGSTENGLIENRALNRDNGDLERVNARLGLAGTWSDSFRSRLTVSREQINNNDNQPVPRNFHDVTYEPWVGTDDQLIWSFGLTNTVALSEAIELNLVTGFYDMDGEEHYVQSATSHSRTDYAERQITQEVRLNGTHGGFDWVLGTYLGHFSHDQTLAGLGAIRAVDTGEHERTTGAVFGEVSQDLTDSLELTAGLRLSRDRVETDEIVVNQTFGFTHGYAMSETFSGWHGRLALAYRPSQTDTLFASIARAYKPGGFQTAHVNAISGIAQVTEGYGSARTVAYEAGYKGQFLDRRLSADITAFFSETEDEQVVGYDPLTFVSQYANIDASAYGLELAARFQATANLSLGGGLSLSRAFATEDADLGWGGLVSDGAQLPNTPTVSYNLHIDWRDDLDWAALRQTLPGLAWFARADYGFTGARWGEATHDNRLDSFGVLDLSLGLESDAMRLEGYAENALDERYTEYSAFGRARPGASLRVGLRGSVYF